tara:strand:+ start:225 stop:1103 length:879 start_codon:yes stop_codon:yes gene_type:complete
MKFGFLIDPKSFECDGFKVAPVLEFSYVLKDFYSTARVSNGWFYGPEIELVKSAIEKEDFAYDAPIVHKSFFHMSSTHRITSTKSYSDDHLRFLILGYGFLQGLYLTPEGYSHLGRIAFKPTTLNGLLLADSDYVNGMECINRFYINSGEEDRNQMFACIHWYLIGQSYQFDWERFDAQYKVLDGIYKLSGTTANSHADRPIVLSKEYNLKLPLWAKLITKKESKLSKQRNELVHEAKYGGYPIGYSYPDENYSLEFRSFNTKLIAATLGINTPYLKAEPNFRIKGRWNIKP